MPICLRQKGFTADIACLMRLAAWGLALAIVLLVAQAQRDGSSGALGRPMRAVRIFGAGCLVLRWLH